MPVVEAVDLRRTYRTTTGTFRRHSIEVEAVRGVSFEIGEGELFGLLFRLFEAEGRRRASLETF